MYEEDLKYHHDSSSEASSLENSLRSREFLLRDRVVGSENELEYPRANSLDSSGGPTRNYE